ncbi:uncharacterized protein BDV14DRAFT_198281 [Aspergillus stella-maris]|uniref:uncharacterized protein n=1 Tax=Aspergillus stella-maris TaxID=1810926 RepID=UPI003CCCAF7F
MVYKLRQPTRRFALEFVEAWSALKILIAASAVLAISAAIGIVSAISLNDAQIAFTIASFILCGGSSVLAIVSSVEASSSDGDSQRQLLLHNMSINHLSPGNERTVLAQERDAKPDQEQEGADEVQEHGQAMQSMLLEQLNKRKGIEAQRKEQERGTQGEFEQRPKSALF